MDKNFTDFAKNGVFQHNQLGLTEADIPCVSPVPAQISELNERQSNDPRRRQVHLKDPRHLGKTAGNADTSAQRTK